MGSSTRSQFSSAAREGGIGRLYLRVAALGLLWCALGIALGINLAIRLQAVRTDAIALSAERLPTALASHRLDKKLAHTDALAHRLIAERALKEVPSTTSARLHDALDGLDAAIETFDPESLSGLDRTSAIEALASATKVSASARLLLAGGSTDDDDTETLLAIATQAALANEHLERLNEEALTPALSTLANQLEAQSRRIVSESLITGAVAFVLGTVLTIVVARLVWNKEHEQANDRQRQDFQSRIADAFGMTDGEDETFRLIEEIVDRVMPAAPCEVLLADSSRAHLRQVAAASGAPRDVSMCSVGSPSACPAVRRGYPISFSSSDDFDACPHLRGRPGGACGATCVPLSVMGQHVGVLHAVTPVDQPLDAVARQRLTVLAAKSGERIGVIRAFAQSEQQAARDPLTGLLNRRSLEGEVQRLQRSGTPFCIAYADIDHFKRLNDTHGHETGDKALRLFSRVLRDSLRPSDVIARWGGEEFVILLPDLELSAARVALDRLRESTAETTKSGTVPGFTISVGATRCDNGDDFFERLDEADAALLAAKGAGRNRVALSESGVTMRGATAGDASFAPTVNASLPSGSSSGVLGTAAARIAVAAKATATAKAA